MNPHALQSALESGASAAGVPCAVSVLERVGSTNTWLGERPAPAPGHAEVA